MELVGAGGKPHVQDIRATRYVCDQDSLALPESHMTSRLDASDDDALIAAARFSELLDIFADDDEMAAINAYSCTLSREPSPIHGCKETGSAFLPPALSFPPEKVSKKEPKMQATVPKKKGSIRRPHHNHGHDYVEKLQVSIACKHSLSRLSEASPLSHKHYTQHNTRMQHQAPIDYTLFAIR